MLKERLQEARPRGFAFVMIKPLGCNPEVRAELVQGLSSFGDITASRRVLVSKEIIEKHYDLAKYDENGNITKHFYPITTYLTNKIVEGLIVEDPNGLDPNVFIKSLRSLIGPSNPIKSNSQQLRHIALERGIPFKRINTHPHELAKISNSYCLDNLIHCSDDINSSMREIEIWFEGWQVVDRYQDIYRGIING